jgi:hypothetical protein
MKLETEFQYVCEQGSSVPGLEFPKQFLYCQWTICGLVIKIIEFQQ